MRLGAEILLGSLIFLEKFFFFVLKVSLGKRPVALAFELNFLTDPQIGSDNDSLMQLISESSNCS